MKTIVTAILALFIFTGCSALNWIDQRPASSMLAVQYSTLKYIGDDQAKAGRVIETVDALAAAIDNKRVTIEAVSAELHRQIRWDQLDAADQMLLRALLAELQMELEKRIGTGLLDADDKVRVQRVMMWVREAAGYVSHTT